MLNLQDYVTKDLGVTDPERQKRLIADMTGLEDVIEKHQLRQQDFSKKQDILTKEIAEQKRALEEAQAKLEERNNRLNAEIAEWGTVSAKTKGDVEKAQKELKALQSRFEKATERVRSLAEAAGQDPDAAVAELTAGAAPQVDLTGYARTDDVTKNLQTLARMALTLPSQLMTIAREHHALTGEDLDTDALVKELETRAGTQGNQRSLNIRDIWEEVHGVSDKRAAKETERINGLVEEAHKKGLEEGRSQLEVPGGSAPPPGRHSAVLTTINREDRAPKLERPVRADRQTSAIQALRSGKYREGAQKTA